MYNQVVLKLIYNGKTYSCTTPMGTNGAYTIRSIGASEINTVPASENNGATSTYLASVGYSSALVDFSAKVPFYNFINECFSEIGYDYKNIEKVTISFKQYDNLSNLISETIVFDSAELNLGSPIAISLLDMANSTDPLTSNTTFNLDIRF